MWIFKCIEARESGVEFRFHLLHRFYEEARHVTIGEGIFTLFVRDYSFWKNLKDFLGDETGVSFTIIYTCIRVNILVLLCSPFVDSESHSVNSK